MIQKSVRRKKQGKPIEYKIATVEQWDVVAREVASKLKSGDVLELSGPLGAGKTTFVQALARVLGATSRPKSPTFSLVRSYRLKVKGSRLECLVHVDAYRIEKPEDVITLGLEELLDQPKTVVAIEWPENVQKWLSSIPNRRVTLSLSVRGEQRRCSVLVPPPQR